jgi:hypothetical protein
MSISLHGLDCLDYSLFHCCSLPTDRARMQYQIHSSPSSSSYCIPSTFITFMLPSASPYLAPFPPPAAHLIERFPSTRPSGCTDQHTCIYTNTCRLTLLLSNTISTAPVNISLKAPTPILRYCGFFYPARLRLPLPFSGSQSPPVAEKIETSTLGNINHQAQSRHQRGHRQYITKRKHREGVLADSSLLASLQAAKAYERRMGRRSAPAAKSSARFQLRQAAH